MEQSKFISQVHSRPCIWNPRVPSYLDRVFKRQAWNEIAAKMYPEFDSCSDIEKTEKVRELQKKWKSLKDYYKRRNPKLDIDQKTKQKKPIVKLLKFLDKVIKFDHHIRAQRRLAERMNKIKNQNLILQLPDYQITVQKCKEKKSLKPRNKRKKNKKNSKTKGLKNELPQNEESKFLQSLLPAMLSLNDHLRFEFKLGLMMLIKKIKYEEEDTHSNTEVTQQNKGFFYYRPAEMDIAPPPTTP